MEITYQKNVDNKGRITIPKMLVDLYGKQWYMIIKENGIIELRPVKKGN